MSFIYIIPNLGMQSKVIIPMLFGILFVGGIQFAFAEELEKETFIAVDEEEFEQPQSKYNYHEVTVIGFIKDYTRGEPVSILIISPDDSEETINTYASKKGDIYTLLHLTSESQIGTYFVILKYHDEELEFTSFEILEHQ